MNIFSEQSFFREPYQADNAGTAAAGMTAGMV